MGLGLVGLGLVGHGEAITARRHIHLHHVAVVDALAKGILAGNIHDGDMVKVDVAASGDGLAVTDA